MGEILGVCKTLSPDIDGVQEENLQNSIGIAGMPQMVRLRDGELPHDRAARTCSLSNALQVSLFSL